MPVAQSAVACGRINPSFRRKPESSIVEHLWIPAFAGMTGYLHFLDKIASSCDAEAGECLDASVRFGNVSYNT